MGSERLTEGGGWIARASTRRRNEGKRTSETVEAVDGEDDCERGERRGREENNKKVNIYYTNTTQ
jgi:hypothetical protein